MDFTQLLDILDRINEFMGYEIFEIGTKAISFSSILFFFFILGLTWICSKYLRKLYDRRIAARLDDGTKHTLRRLLHYMVMAVGVLVAIDFIGIDLTSLAVVASFLSVGIGFGLRNIASNFISGIILMIERPISVGDFISVDDFLGTVKDIGLRATVFRTVDNQSIVIPNSTFLEQNVINWTKGEKSIRLRFPVGVAYGSDVEKTKSTLLEAAESLDEIRGQPEPKVLFKEFGDSALNFELRVWINHANERVSVRDELNTRINELFKQNDLEMPFPQRDLHVRSSTSIPVSNEMDGDT